MRAPGVLEGGQLATMGTGDLPGDRQAQTGAPGRTLTAGVQANEPLEDPLPLRGRDARPVVDDIDERAARTPVGSELHAAGGVSRRVVDEIS